jgi:hypothetical protein
MTREVFQEKQSEPNILSNKNITRFSSLLIDGLICTISQEMKVPTNVNFWSFYPKNSSNQVNIFNHPPPSRHENCASRKTQSCCHWFTNLLKLSQVKWEGIDQFN